MITIDSRRCGGGKTTDPQNGIYNRIKQHLAKNDRVLVVVPSIALQKQYLKDLAELYPYIINSEDTTESTTQRVLSCFRNPVHNLVIITHQAFIRIPQTGYKCAWHLIIDEALEEVIRIENVSATEQGVWNPNFDLSTIFDWANATEQEYYNISNHDDTRWGHLKLIRTPQASMLDSSDIWRKLTNSNYDVHMTAKSWTTLQDQCGGRVKIIQTLDPVILGGYQSIHIAAAAFEYTAMAWWMKANKIKFSIVNAFVPHLIDGRIHSVERMKWSKNKLNTQPEILEQFQKYVAGIVKCPVIALRNSSANNTSYVEVEQKLKHNSYGINNKEWWSSTAISLETALVPDTLLSGYIKEHWMAGMSNTAQDKAITHLFSAYRFMQAIYRSAIRTANPQPIDIFVIDEDVAARLTDYFDFKDITKSVVNIDIKQKQSKPSGRPMKYLNEDQRKEANRLRMRQKRQNK